MSLMRRGIVRKLHSIRSRTAAARSVVIAAPLTILCTASAYAITGPITYGHAGDVPLIAHWHSNGKYVVGVYRLRCQAWRWALTTCAMLLAGLGVALALAGDHFGRGGGR
jgi:hypothetical protein